MSDLVSIPVLGEYRRLSVRYDYKADPCLCPACGGVGMPWRGWFSCDSCTCIARVDTGEAFESTERAAPLYGVRAVSTEEPPQ